MDAKSIKIQGSVVACGVVAGPKLDLTVFPFILRGVNLLGADSALWPMEQRKKIWQKLATKWKISNLESVSKTIYLQDLDDYIALILKGQIQGRTVVAIH